VFSEFFSKNLLERVEDCAVGRSFRKYIVSPQISILKLMV
jgi:hypothetical protein